MSISNIPSKIKRLCVNEFNRQLDETDGSVFVYSSGTFQGIDLADGREKGLHVLHCFSDYGCPISIARLCVALHPEIGQTWPESCRIASRDWLARLIYALEVTVYDPVFTDTYSSLVGSPLDKDLMLLLSFVSRDLPEDTTDCVVFQQASYESISLFQPRGAFV